MGRISIMLEQIDKSSERFGEYLNNFHGEDKKEAIAQIKQMQRFVRKISNRLLEVKMELEKTVKKVNKGE